MGANSRIPQGFKAFIDALFFAALSVLIDTEIVLMDCGNINLLIAVLKRPFPALQLSNRS